MCTCMCHFPITDALSIVGLSVISGVCYLLSRSLVISRCHISLLQFTVLHMTAIVACSNTSVVLLSTSVKVQFTTWRKEKVRREHCAMQQKERKI
uniref:Uncharacterized protein n=1 Tax=Rhipicephalus zambeziensis TaxID=60191 RepID=A0A224YGQ3_9ACAR